MLVKTILNECFGIKEYLIIDNELARYNSEIKSIAELKNEDYLEDTEVLYSSYNYELKHLLNGVEGIKQIVDIFENARGVARENQDISNIKCGNIGRYSYGGLAAYNPRIESIGAFCSFASGATAVWNHPLNMVTQHDFIYESTICREIDNQKYTMADFNKKFVIGNDVWLGANVILTNGVRIGNGVRAAAGSVITKDVPDYAIVAGVPAKIIRFRFTKEQIEKLNKIRWWDWPIEKIRECYDDFLDIDVFLEKHYSI